MCQQITTWSPADLATVVLQLRAESEALKAEVADLRAGSAVLNAEVTTLKAETVDLRTISQGLDAELERNKSKFQVPATVNIRLV